MIQLSVVIITYQEERNIAKTIQAILPIAEEILVIDSYSTDKTVDIARNLGARILQRPFKDMSDQKIYGYEQALHDHILSIDADEVVSEELLQSIRTVKENWDFDAYALDRINQFADKWIHHGAWYPDYNIRLFDRTKVQSVLQRGHDEILPKPGATTSKLIGKLYHYTAFDVKTYQSKMNVLSSLAADALFRKGQTFKWWRLLLKPAYRFFSEFVLKRGFLDGFYGYVIAKTSAHFVFQREVKLWEQWKQQQEKLG